MPPSPSFCPATTFDRFRPVDDAINNLAGLISGRRLFESAETVVVAVSGGLDSVCLLRVLHALAPRLQIKLVAAHANHQLRPEANVEEAFVREVCAPLGISLHTDVLRVREAAGRTGDSLEMAARRLRHGFLARVARDAGAQCVALAHHADDQAELFFLRLLRGAGGEGLGGMTWTSRSPADPGVRLVRPFLNTTRSSLRSLAQSNGWTWVEDATNADISILRNWVRSHLLPMLDDRVGTGVRNNVVRTMSVIRDEADFVSTEADRWIENPGGAAFETLHAAVQRAVIRRRLWEAGVEVTFDLIERLRLGGAPVTVGPGVRVKQGSGRVALERKAPTEAPRPPKVLSLKAAAGRSKFAGRRLIWRVARKAPDRIGPGGRAFREWFDADRVGKRVVLRTWRPGDRFRPLGFPRPSKLQNLFVNRKVPIFERSKRWVAESSAGEIFWVEGLPPGEAFKVTEGTRRWLEWRWEGSPDGRQSEQLEKTD
jgi:tRNA(Ile)-lysidine synthase